MQLLPPRGMRDFYPEELRLRNWLFSTWRDCALRYGFEEYDGSVVEHEDLYVLKSGPEILEQLFHFVDKGGRRVALRPEMTPTLARLIAGRGGSLPKPLKWFSVAQCFRYERMTRGRKREHYQWNLDIVGVHGVLAEAELLATALDALGRLGLTAEEVVVRVNHRQLLTGILAGIGIPSESWPGVFGAIDKRGKEPEDVIWKSLLDLGISEEFLKILFSMLNGPELGVFRGFLEDKGLDPKPVADLERLFELLGDYGVCDFVEFCPSIVRGLPYYTGVVFECFDREGAFRAIFGGGRYDNLMGIFSAGDLPAVGLGFGDVVIREILEEKRKLPVIAREIDLFLIPYSEAERALSIRAARGLRGQGLRVELLLEEKRLKAALKDAARSNAHWAVLFLPEELQQGLLVLRDLTSGREQRVPEKPFLEEPRGFLSPQSQVHE
jgi:histidyl-tRNA synthetase